jgi:acetolactate synthase-1/3 small subunit
MPEPAITLHFTAGRYGALDRIVSLLRRRGFPIAGMTVERTHRPEVGRMTVVVEHPAAVEQVSRHLRKLPDVIEVSSASAENTIRRQYALLRIHCPPERREEVLALIQGYGARTVSANGQQLIVEAWGDEAELDGLFAELAPYGIEESARTGTVAMSCEP